MAMRVLALSERALRHATLVGRVWLPVLFLVRVLTLALAETSVWAGEASHFVCNSHQPGCSTTCYGSFSPMTYPQYWFLHLLLVTCPSLLYLGTSICVPQMVQDPHAKKVEWLPTSPEDTANVTSPPELHGSNPRTLPRFYILSLLIKVLLEAGCIVGQYYFLGFKVPGSFVCQKEPCPHNIDCFIPNPTKKNIFIALVLGQTGASLLLTLLEMLFLVLRRLHK
ncbi:gap junction alpha-8 protein-like [Ascaphus truei]|uniref:gap junction alpha-8 protein-like n=1 Tax=Ascaphus truei TaxID=8439 RepID=UPI003F59F96E